MRAQLIGALLVLALACAPGAAGSGALSRSTAAPSATLSLPSSVGTPVPASTPPTAGAKPISLAAIQRLDARIGFVTDWYGTGRIGLAKTTDSGATWQRIPVPASFITALRFVDENVGWAAAFVLRVGAVSCQQAAPANVRPCRGVVLRTVDGGRTWRETLSIETNGILGYPVQQLQAVDADRAWVITRPSDLCSLPCPTDLRSTTDGGRTWTNLQSGNIVAIRFASASRGWSAIADPVGAVVVRSTSDGGRTWRDALRIGRADVVALDAATIQMAWVLSRDGAYCTASNCLQYELFRTLDGGASWSSLGNPKDHGGNCSPGHLAGPLFASETHGWLALNLGAGGVAAPGGLMATDDGGLTWRCATTLPNTSLISAADPLHVWTASQDRSSGGTILYSSDDGGTKWHMLDLTALR